MASRGRGLGYQTAGATSFPAPVGGLNDRDSLADMPVDDAVILENWWPLPSKLSVRKGRTTWATGFTEPVNTVVEYSPADGLNELFAASGDSIYNVTASGPIDAPVVTGQINDQWQDVSITTPGGSFLYLLNGVDDPLLYDGTTWTPVNAGSTPAITGVPTAVLVQGAIFKNRIFFVERDSMRLWFLGVQAIGGAASPIDMGAVFQRGGSIMAIATWTIDAGAGMDDHAVIISSEGEVAVYQGTDPTVATGFSLVGVFYLGRPIGRRCAIKYGGDVLVICEQGIFPLGSALLSSSVDRKASVGDKIQNSINAAVNQSKLNFGWELCLHPEQNALILTIPKGGGGNYQFAQNTITGAWTKFTGWDATTFKNTSLGLFYGSQTTVEWAWTGNTDGGSMIVADVLQSFQDLRSPAVSKYFTMVRPYIQSDGNPSILYGINGDYVQQAPTGVLSFTPPDGMIWGSMIWGQMIWGGSMRELSGWNTVGGIYKTVGMRLRVQNNASQVDWASTSFVYNRGGIL